MSIEQSAMALCTLIVLAPLIALLSTAALAVLDVPIDERRKNWFAQLSIAVALAGALGMSILLYTTGRQSIVVELGHWVALQDDHFSFALTFLFDWLSLPFLLLSLVLSGAVAAFARVYLHREPGYRRFYLLFMMFVAGLSISSVAGDIEILFAGWELVGLSSALLVGFFQERRAPVQNGLRVWTVYRFSDAAFLIAAIALHHFGGEGDFARLIGVGDPSGGAVLTPNQALLVGSLLLVAAAGKSGLLPFSGWLPRAMEGPTPSSAIFYGALSIHLGAFLLLRVHSVIAQSSIVCVLLVAVGLATAAWSTLVSRAQADIKNVLAFASLTQVGIIVAEIGCGLHRIALIHIIGNACLRTLQLLRAPSLLHDLHQIERAIGARVAARGAREPNGWSLISYRIGYERVMFDALLERWIVNPFRWAMAAAEGVEHAFTRWLNGEPRAHSASRTDSKERERVR